MPLSKQNHASSFLSLASVCLAAMLLPFSFTGPAVVLSALADEFAATPQSLNWVVNAFMLSFGSSLMAAGTLADRFGRKRVFLSGVGLLLLSSIQLCLVHDILMLDMLRAVQGVAGAAAIAGGSAALAQEFEGQARLQAFSFLGTSFGIGLAFGPLLAAILSSRFGLRAIFASIALLGLLALCMGWRYLRESREQQAPRLDWLGALSFTAALSLLTLAVLQAPQHGWGASLLPLSGAVIMGAVFIAVEKRVARPMLDLSLFRIPRFVGVQVLAAAPAYAYIVLLIVLPLYLVGIQGYDEVAAGRVMLALSAPMLVLPMLAARLARSVRPASLCACGLLMNAVGLLWLADGAGAQINTWPLLLIGCGISLPWGLMDGLAVSVVPTERAGMATGIFSTTRVAFEGIALAVVMSLMTYLLHSQLDAQIAHLDAHNQPQMLAASLEAASHLALGQLRQANDILPGLASSSLTLAYEKAFHILLYVLAGITLLAALTVFICLQPAEGEVKESATELEQEAA